MVRREQISLALALCIAGLAACSGGGGSSPGPSPSTPTPVPTPTASTSTQQVIRLAIPTSAIGSLVDPTYGTIGGYTQTVYSQILGFAPGQQVMIENANTGVGGAPHTLGDTGASGSFPATQPATLSMSPVGGNTLSAGFQTGTLTPGQAVGPVTLSAGTYLIGCAFHYQSNNMRDVLIVAAAATPGPQATQPPGVPTPMPTSSGGGGGYGY